MFKKSDLKLIERTVEACEAWDGVNWEKTHDDSRLVFTLYPSSTITYDGRTEIYAKNFEEFIREVQKVYEYFDPDEETSLWIGPDGHGKNGAPFKIRDILDEMEALDQAYQELAMAFARLN